MAKTSERPKAPRRLTDRQQCFIAAYIDTLDSRAAAIAAGYAPARAESVAVRLLARRDVVEAIARSARTQAAAREPLAGGGITRSWISEEITDLYRIVKSCLPAPGEGDGKPPSASALQTVIRALELLIKHLETAGPGADAEEPEPDLSRLDRDELRQLEGLLAKAQGEPGPAFAGAA